MKQKLRLRDLDRPEIETAADSPRTPVYLNNALLTNRPAVIKRAWEFSDWGGA